VITHLSISNYRSIGEDLDLSLGPLTALVGPNGSGKLNITDAFRFLADTLRMGLDAAVTKRQGFPGLRRWSAGRPFNIKLALTVKEPGGSYGKYAIELGSAKDDYRVKREHAQCAVAHSDGMLAGLAGLPEEFEVRDGRWISGPADLKPKVDAHGLALPLIAADARFRPLADAMRNVAIYSIFPRLLTDLHQEQSDSKPCWA
jgi:predicted ATPase